MPRCWPWQVEAYPSAVSVTSRPSAAAVFKLTHQLETSGPFDRQIAHGRAVQDLADQAAGSSEELLKLGPISEEATSLREIRELVHGRHTSLERELR